MARYSVASAATKASQSATDAVQWCLKAGSAKSLAVYEVGVFLESGTAAAIGFALFRQNAAGTATASDTPAAEDPSSGATAAVLEKTWSANPTLTTVAFRRGTTPATLGTGFIWTFPDPGLVIAAGGGLVITQTAAAITANLRCYVAYDER